MTNTTSIGGKAESLVCEYLTEHGYQILDRNYKQPTFEIDIIAKKGDAIYMVEVKFRSKAFQGSGLDYVTPQKLKQLKYAGEMWCVENDWAGDWRIMAASVAISKGESFVEELIEVN